MTPISARIYTDLQSKATVLPRFSFWVTVVRFVYMARGLRYRIIMV